MTPPVGSVFAHLRTAAAAFCPPLELVAEEPERLAVALRDPVTETELRLRYRSERGLFLRTYFLVVEADVSGAGPAEAGELVLRRRGLVWRRPRPRDAGRWEERLLPPQARSDLKGLPLEQLSLRWRPEQASWHLALETQAGSVVATFFPPLETPNPLHRGEAAAIHGLVESVRRATG